MTRTHFLTDASELEFGSAAVAILLDESGRYLLQRRDDMPRIWYPGHWGFFGGAIEPGEDALQAVIRELVEEIGIALPPERFELFTRHDFTLSWRDGTRRGRDFFTAVLRPDEIARLVLGEGAEMRFVSGEEALATLPLAPYDSFGLFLHHARSRVR